MQFNYKKYWTKALLVLLATTIIPMASCAPIETDKYTEKPPKKTTVIKPDTDGDSVIDEYEISIYGTDPLMKDAWNDFDAVADILNTPDKIIFYLDNNFTCLRSPSHNPDLREVFIEKKGDCDEYAGLATYWLDKNGYEANILKIDFDKWWEEYNTWYRHDICVYKEKDNSYYYIDIDFHGSDINPVGPYNSIEEICDQIPSHHGFNDWISYRLLDADWNLVKQFDK